ncbi:site-specific integrase [Streptomyces poriferorum]|uniref:Site-specific integrase n=1 Tax=Streptomyces poriferorum TaxID=2798799 RepID=A0ABY9IYJ0_9ACTN|nr:MULTISPECIES: site-specific integrase [unclassified Streptomyces]MDP5310359.1 site-specific integrase [Streptomyces sp. Alt4]WLQ60486.1 site-specific integrase [Streptomyces sp. Alt2]
MTEPDEVVVAELVDEDNLPAAVDPGPIGRPLVDRHTILRPNAPIPTTADLPTYTEADFRISQETAELLDQSPPENTSRTYNSARRRFEAWCRENDRVHLPCTTATFVEYVGHLVRADKSPSTIQVAMSAIRSWHQDGQQPGTKEASEALRKHARGWAQRRTAKKAPAIRTDMLAAMVATCASETDADYPKATRDAALLTLGWGMLSRRSELAHLLIQQLTIGPTGIHVLVAFSKTDQAAKGNTTFVPDNPDDPATCPVVRIRAWLEELRRQGVTDGPLFRHINRGGTIRHRAGGPEENLLTPDAIGAIVKARAKLANLPDPSKITAHGLRRGPAQEIAEAGEDPTGQGRWKPGSLTVQKHYVEPARSEADNTITAMRRKKAAAAAKEAEG